MLLTAEAERRYIQAIFAALGATAAEADAQADVLVEADLRGHTAHGLARMPLAVELLQAERCRVGARPRVVAERGAAALMDGDGALGPYGATAAMREAMRRAREKGAAAVGLYHTGDVALAGYYAELAARADLIGLVFAKAEASVHPHGGAEPIVGTNPIAVAIPTMGDPLLLDMATSAATRGKLVEAAAAGRPIPLGWAIDASGTPTTDPQAALEGGALSAVGGAKGYGLALVVELLAGVLTGAGAGPMQDAAGWAQLWGVLFLALDPAAFVDVAAFKEAVSAYLAQIKASRLAPGVAQILLPGERSYRTRRAQLARGIILPDDVWAAVAAVARPLGLDPDTYLAPTAETGE
ncbi:MAG TPA: Ldh family oxidoreductase [Chloroflexota bacterium]|jgi:LDH2 family malate/lactate/ureidoglycolate dehydrogenase